MEIRVDDGQIHPLHSRVTLTTAKLTPEQREALVGLAPLDDAGRLLAYSDPELKALRATLDALALAHEVQPDSQPDPTLLTSLQGKCRTRTEALAALAKGEAPVTLADLAARVKAIEAKPVAKPL